MKPSVFLEKLVIDGQEYEVETDGTFKSAVKALEEAFDQRYERWREIAYDSIGDDDYEPEEDYDD